MASLGRKPGAAPLTSADIPDNSVTAAKVTADVATQAEIDLKADKASPTFTGTPAVPTAAAATNTTQAASTAYVRTEVTNLVDSAPAALDTLNELAAALGDDASFSTTVTNSIATKAPKDSPTFTGNVVFNESSADANFRIENDGQANAFFLDGAASAGSVRMYVGSDTGVGLASSQQSQLQFNNYVADNVGGISIHQWSGANSQRGTVNFAKSLGSTFGSYTVLTTGRPMGAICWYGADGTDFTNQAAEIEVVANTVGSNDIGGDMLFKTSAGSGATPTTRMTIDEDGNVGIGVTAPDVDLHVLADVRIGTSAGLHTRGSLNELMAYNNTSASGLYLNYSNNGDVFLAGTGKVGIGTTSPDGNLEVVGSQTTNGVHFKTGGGSGGAYILKASNYAGTEYFQINSSGNVGIGTASPVCKLDVVGGDNGLIADFSGVGNPYLKIVAGSNSADYQTTNTDAVLNLGTVKTSGDWRSIHAAGGAVFCTNGGKVGIGTTSPTYPLHVKGTSTSCQIESTNTFSGIEFLSTTVSRTLGFSMGQFYVDGVHGTTPLGSNITTMYCSDGGYIGTSTSLREAKANIGVVSINTDIVYDTEILSFNYKARNDLGEYTDEVDEFLSVGAIAEDVELLDPNFVFYDKDGKLKGIKYERYVPYLVKAIQELSTKVTALENA